VDVFAAFIALGLLPAIVVASAIAAAALSSVIWVISPQRSPVLPRWVLRYRFNSHAHIARTSVSGTTPCAHIRARCLPVSFPITAFRYRGQRVAEYRPQGPLQATRHRSCRAVPWRSRVQPTRVQNRVPTLATWFRGPGRPWVRVIIPFGRVHPCRERAHATLRCRCLRERLPSAEITPHRALAAANPFPASITASIMSWSTHYFVGRVKAHIGDVLSR